MTKEWQKRRGRSVARSVAVPTLALTITEDPKYGSMARFARKALGISRQRLCNYHTGLYPCPRNIADKVKEIYPDLAWLWPAGISE